MSERILEKILEVAAATVPEPVLVTKDYGEQKAAAETKEKKTKEKKTKEKKTKEKKQRRYDRKCEDCGLKWPSFGLPVEGKKWWCAGCAKAHVGAKSLGANKMCEGCGLKQPSFGLPAEGKKWWCAGCAKAHVGSEDIYSKRCEGCGLKQPNFGLPAEGKKWWCAGCAKAHVGVEDIYKKIDERNASPAKRERRGAYIDFLNSMSSFGVPTTGCVCTGCHMCDGGTILRPWCANSRQVADHCPGSLGHDDQTQVRIEAVCCITTCFTTVSCCHAS
jgi:hypothetical protein